MKDNWDDLIRRWQPKVPEPSAFQREVWTRIERRTNADSWLERFFSGLARPRIASVATALTLLAGALLGSALAGGQGRNLYLRAVNPYAQMAVK